MPRIAREAAPALLRQHLQLADVDASSVTGDNWREWLQAQIARFGEFLPVEPMTADEHEYREPISEAAERFPPDRIGLIQAGS